MKKLLYSTFIFASSLVFSQSQNLAKLANGEMVNFNAIYDQKENLFGYVGIYNYGKTSDTAKKFEYVILDKNLNPIANRDFEGDKFAGGYSAFMDFRENIVLSPKLDRTQLNIFKLKDIVIPRTKIISLKDNSIKNKDYFEYEEDGKFTKLDQPKNILAQYKEDKIERKSKGYMYESLVYEIKQGGYLALEYRDYKSYSNNNSLIKFDDDKKEIWRYRYNTSGDKKNNESLTLIEKDDDKVYCILQNNAGKEKNFQLLVLDMKTGKEIVKKPISGLPKNTLDKINSVKTFSFGTLDNSKTLNDKIVLVGRNIDDNNKYTGFARLVINKNNFEIDTKEITYESLKSQIPKLGNYGTVEAGYFLDPRDFFFLQDGSVGILLEKYKAEGQYNAPKTTDMVYIYTDKNFNPSVKIFEKEKSKWSNSDYLFSQYINHGKDVVFFYRDYQKEEGAGEKKWNLFINTLIDGKFKQEIVPISAKDDFYVSPYVGKEGYILLREYNKKEKFNNIRLERLNF